MTWSLVNRTSSVAIALHFFLFTRDTTVQSLTVQPTVKDGVIIYEDSALVRAVRLGHALVVDEADKAPTHVTCVLKALLESGRATLADGRKIVTGGRLQ